MMMKSNLLKSHRNGAAMRIDRVAGVAQHRRLARSSSLLVNASSSGKMKLFSPSKINLFLRVIRKREDGYHDLASLFHVIDLGDDMAFSLLPPGSTSDTLKCSDPTIPSDSSNLVIKALDLFRRKSGVTSFFAIDLVKKVPHGAGLGGGSGNAATTLWAANELTGRPATNDQLLAWSGDIGSDISVFFSKGAAYCTGRGEIVEDVHPPLPLETPMLLVKPPVGLATPKIFKSLDLSKRSTEDPLELLKGLSQSKDMPQSLAVNDLEQPAFDNLPELLALKQRLQKESPASRFSAVFMTGSGSTLVCMGGEARPAFLDDKVYSELFVSPARLIVRKPGSWYVPSREGVWTP